jgi:hypothetical protein
MLFALLCAAALALRPPPSPLPKPNVRLAVVVRGHVDVSVVREYVAALKETARIVLESNNAYDEYSVDDVEVDIRRSVREDTAAAISTSMIFATTLGGAPP